MNAPPFAPLPLVVELAPAPAACCDAPGSDAAGLDAVGPNAAGLDAGGPGALVRVPYAEGQTLAQAVYLSGRVAPPVLCSGLARCGRCRMRLHPPPPPCPADSEAFSPDELALGWRLACRHSPAPGLLAELPEDAVPLAPEDWPDGPGRGAEGPEGPYPPASGPAFGSASGSAFGPAFGPEPEAGQGAGERSAQTSHDRGGEGPDTRGGPLLAVDLGTTSMQWRFLPPPGRGGPPGPDGRLSNPQAGAGSDLVSRLAAALDPQGAERLRALTLAALRRLVRQGGAAGLLPRALCLAANPGMTCIALGLPVHGLARAPYVLPYRGGRWEALPGLPPVWTPPQLSPFVGGDIAAGYAALALDPLAPPPVYPFLLADMGTNGEFLLALSGEKALTASVALGPALEGVGLSRGTEARPLAAVDLALGPAGLALRVLPRREGGAPRPLGPGEAASGMTGAGYLALLRLLVHSKAMDVDGRFTPERAGPLGRLLRPVDGGGQRFLPLPGGLALFASDVEESLKVKAAFSLGLARLLEAAGLASADLAGIYLAGALGLHVKKEALDQLGFFPPGTAGRIRAVGNSALAGAALLARSAPARKALCAWARGVDSLDLASDAAFVRGFADHMRFAW